MLTWLMVVYGEVRVSGFSAMGDDYDRCSLLSRVCVCVESMSIARSTGSLHAAMSRDGGFCGRVCVRFFVNLLGSSLLKKSL